MGEPVQEEQAPTSSFISAFLPKPKIPSGTTISGIYVGGMTQEQALSTLQRSVSHVHENEDMVLSAGEQTLRLTPEKSNVHWNLDKAVESALNGE